MPDATILRQVGPYAVLTRRYEIQFADGTAVWLHDVIHQGAPATFLRALVTPGDVASVIVFDTRKLDDGLDEDLRACPRRDAPGIVFYTLRARFKTAAACVASIVQHRLDAHWPAAGAIAA